MHTGGDPLTIVNIECPCGLVRAKVTMRDCKPAEVSFESVPSFLFARDQVLTLGNWARSVLTSPMAGRFMRWPMQVNSAWNSAVTPSRLLLMPPMR